MAGFSLSSSLGLNTRCFPWSRPPGKAKSRKKLKARKITSSSNYALEPQKEVKKPGRLARILSKRKERKLNLQHQVLDDDDNCSTISFIFSGHDPLALSFGQDEFSQFTGYTVASSADNRPETTFVDVKSYWEAEDDLFRIISDMGSNYMGSNVDTTTYDPPKEFSTSPTTPKRLQQTQLNKSSNNTKSMRPKTRDQDPTGADDIFSAPVSLISYELGEGLFDEAKFFSSPEISLTTPPRHIISRPREESPTPIDDRIHLKQDRFGKTPKTPETQQSELSGLHGETIFVPRQTNSPPTVKRLHRSDLYATPKVVPADDKKVVTPPSRESQSTTPTIKTTPTSLGSSDRQREEPVDQRETPAKPHVQSDAAVTCVQIIRPNHEDEIQLVFNELEQEDGTDAKALTQTLPSDLEKYSDPGLTPLASISFEEEIPGAGDAEWWKNAFQYNVAPLDLENDVDSTVENDTMNEGDEKGIKCETGKPRPRSENRESDLHESEDGQRLPSISKKVRWSLPEKSLCTAMNNVDGLFELPHDDEAQPHTPTLQDYSSAHLLNYLNKKVPGTKNHTPKSCMKPPSPVRQQFAIPGEHQIIQLRAALQCQSSIQKPFDETDSDEDDVGLNAFSLDSKGKAMSLYQQRYEKNMHALNKSKSQPVLKGSARKVIPQSMEDKAKVRLQLSIPYVKTTEEKRALDGSPQKCGDSEFVRNFEKRIVAGSNGDNWWISSCQPLDDDLTLVQSYDETMTYDESAKDTVVSEENNWLCAFEEEEIDFTGNEDLGMSAWKASGLKTDSVDEDDGKLDAPTRRDWMMTCGEAKDDSLSKNSVTNDLDNSERRKCGMTSCGVDEDEMSLDGQSRDNDWRLGCEGRDGGYFTIDAVTDDTSFDTQMMEESGI